MMRDGDLSEYSEADDDEMEFMRRMEENSGFLVGALRDSIVRFLAFVNTGKPYLQVVFR